MKKLLLAGLLLQMGLSVTLPVPANATTFHTVTFFENPKVASSVLASQTSSIATNLTSFSSLSPQFSNPGYTFFDWNTSPNGTGTSYANAAVYGFGSDLSLYAQWKPAFHNVSFFENATSSDSKYSLETKNAPTTLTLFTKLSPAFSKVGYSFSSWNTKADGSGTKYANGATFSFATDLTLFAQWVKLTAVPVMEFVGAVSSDHPRLVQPIVNRIESLGKSRISIVRVGNSSKTKVLSLQIGSHLRRFLTSLGYPVVIHFEQTIAPGQMNMVEVFVS